MCSHLNNFGTFIRLDGLQTHLHCNSILHNKKLSVRILVIACFLRKKKDLKKFRHKNPHDCSRQRNLENNVFSILELLFSYISHLYSVYFLWLHVGHAYHHPTRSLQTTLCQYELQNSPSPVRPMTRDLMTLTLHCHVTRP